MMQRLLISTIVLGLVAAPASAQVDQLLKGLGVGQQSGLSEVKIGDGLKQALRVATEKSVSLTGRPNGYFSNAAIKILMPEKLQTVDQGLPMFAYAPQADQFLLSMTPP